jgi:hypothetical protein
MSSSDKIIDRLQMPKSAVADMAQRDRQRSLPPLGSDTAGAKICRRYIIREVRAEGRLGRVLINAQIAAPLVAEFVQESAGLFKKQQLTGLF